MNKDQFHVLLRNPSGVSSHDAEALEKLLNTFPYCNVANILLAKVNSDKGSMFSNQKIKRAALVSSSREKLKSLLYSKQVVATKSDNEIAIETSLISDVKYMQQASFAHEEIAMAEKKTSETPIEPIKTSSDESSGTLQQSLQDDSKSKMQNLRDEIQEILQSLKGLEAEFRDKITTEPQAASSQKKNPLDVIKEGNAEILILKDETNLEITNILEDQPMKFYVHDLNFGKSLRSATSDAINEYLNFRPRQTEQKPNLGTQASIIEKFLVANTQMPRFGDMVDARSKPDLSRPSTKIEESPVSENMANILVKQGKNKKAIEVLEKLKLKYPEKSAYFAGKIDNLNSLNS